jgi:hypothetical protein
MMPLILSLVSATLFLMLSSWTYGADAILANAWVTVVFFGLIGSGALISMLGRQTSA